MSYFRIDPEHSGGIGPRTILDFSDHPPIVKRLHFEFEVWLKDDLVQGHPCFLATKRLGERIKAGGFTGVRFREADEITSELLHEHHPDWILPHFVWLDITGKPGEDDFGLRKPRQLIVSQRALDALRTFNLNHCEVFPYVR